MENTTMVSKEIHGELHESLDSPWSSMEVHGPANESTGPLTLEPQIHTDHLGWSCLGGSLGRCAWRIREIAALDGSATVRCCSC